MEFDWNNPPFELGSSLTQREIEESFEDPFAIASALGIWGSFEATVWRMPSKKVHKWKRLQGILCTFFFPFD